MIIASFDVAARMRSSALSAPPISVVRLKNRSPQV